MALQVSNSLFLTILGPAPPQPPVAVPQGVPRVAREVLQPFQFNQAGQLAFTQDPATVISTHMLELLFTMKGERVMQPQYGIGAQRYLFEPNDVMIQAELVQAIKDQVSLWDPGLNLLSVEPLPSDFTDGQLMLRVSFTIGPSPAQYTITFNLSGQRIETVPV
jgi:phage baseplate assembly protein W